jgi:hypothetical protein
MKRHLIFGRFGTTDNIGIPSADGEQATPLPFVAANRRIEHDITDSLSSLATQGIYPSERGVDLLILAAHVQAADTRIFRDSESQDGWTRELRLVVPVSDPALWNVSIPLLQRLLNFLTGDRWTVGFRARPEGFEQIALRKPAQLIPPPFDCLSLFSGGLDSLIGSIDLLEHAKSPLLVSHAGDGTVSHSQQVIYEGLKKQYSKQNFHRLRVWMDFRRWSVSGVEPDKKTRGRSFLFFAAGAFAGSGFADPFTLYVPENGLIALNVPLDPLRLGAFSTRTTHPFYIARWNELLQVIGIDGRIENPYWNKTKGEMVQECANPTLLAALGPESFSCASPNKGRWTGHGPEHCGFCLPCLIRRASLRGTDQTPYTLADLSAGELDTTKAKGQQVRSFQLAINRVRENPSLARLLIHKPGPLSDESTARQDALADVYLRGLAELDALLAGVRTAPS